MTLIWYAAYGSNMHADRLRHYLRGGTPPGGRRTYPGCRDPAEPRATAPVMLPGGIWFTGESSAWTGGYALYDPQLPGAAAARAYLLTAGQFADLVAQEMYRPPGADLADLAEVVRAGRLTLGPGRYETLVYAGARSGQPMLTFTAGFGRADGVPARPAPAYLGMLARGLRESHRWDAAQITTYLLGRPGVAGAWDPADLAAVVAAALPG